MSMLDDILAGAGVDKLGTKRLADTGQRIQHQLRLRELDRHRKELAAELGSSLYYETREDERFRAGRESLYDQIAQADLEREQLRSELGISELDQQTVVCPSCGKPLNREARFCVHCGFPIAEVRTSDSSPELVQPESAATCPHCGYSRTSEDLFCLHCGAPLDQ